MRNNSAQLVDATTMTDNREQISCLLVLCQKSRENLRSTQAIVFNNSVTAPHHPCLLHHRRAQALLQG